MTGSCVFTECSGTISAFIPVYFLGKKIWHWQLGICVNCYRNLKKINGLSCCTNHRRFQNHFVHKGYECGFTSNDFKNKNKGISQNIEELQQIYMFSNPF